MKWILRIGAVLLALPLLCAGVLWAMGMRSGAGHMHASAEIHAAPEQVWQWLDEGDRQKQWVSWLVEVREGPAGTHAVGTQRTWVMRDENNGGQLMEIPFTYTAYAPPTQMGVRTVMPGMMEGQDIYRLTDLGNGTTRIEADGQFEYRMWLARLMEPLITASAQTKMNGDIAKLKEMVEKNVATAAR